MAVLAIALCVNSLRAEIIIAEGEQFKPQDAKGWKVTHQDDTYGSHTYGGMWMTHGGCLGAPTESVDSVATQAIIVKDAGKFRVWSKYQAPPYYNYLHKIDITQNGKIVFSHVYGKSGTDRLWSFSGKSDELWWPWGVDHDTAEAPAETAELAAGAAEVRLITVKNDKPAGDRFVDFIVLTTNPKDEYQGHKPYAVGSPFTLEALAATKLYARFKHDAAAAAQIAVTRNGHFQPNYGAATEKFPANPVAAGQWSEWFNIGPLCRLVHDEGLFFELPGTKSIELQFARDDKGTAVVGDCKLSNKECAVVPIDITWRKDARVRPSRELAEEVITLSKKWRTANAGKKPKEILYYGAFSGQEEWVLRLKDALGYNTGLPDTFDHVACDGLHAHVYDVTGIKKFAETLKDKQKFRVLSFGDEISIGEIKYDDPKLQDKFRAWLKSKGITKDELGVEPADATLSKTAGPRIAWYSNLFNEEERFAVYREMTRVARASIGPDVLTGANYSPHHLALYYGPVYQWVDIFKQNGMSMFWAEDYTFSVPEVPQILSWALAEARCAVKYNKQPIHFYIMPHAPGQEPGFLRRNMMLAVGCGARHIDNFWIGPEERFTENYVAWTAHKTFRVLHESIYDSAEVEKIQAKGVVRPAHVAVVLSKATDFNESRLMVEKEKDPFTKRCKNADAKINQILCRKDQQMLYLALRQAQYEVDLITEDDIADGILDKYMAVYFAGEWIDSRAVKKLDDWVQKGGVLYATAGCGQFNQFGEPEPAMRKLLGLKDAKLDKNAIVIRTLLELPLMEPIDTITLDGQKIGAIGMKQTLMPDTAKVVGTWSDGTAAVTVREHGKGKAFAVGTLAGNSYMKTALKVTPWARGGHHMLYNPVDFDPAATKLVRLGLSAATNLPRNIGTSPTNVEGIAMDSPDGTLVTLVNWSNDVPLKKVQVQITSSFKPRTVRSVTLQKELEHKYENGVVTLSLELSEAEYLLLEK